MVLIAKPQPVEQKPQAPEEPKRDKQAKKKRP